MARVARTVFPGVPHHVTQRGSRRGQVFFSEADRRTYLDWLAHYCQRYGVEVLGYCLMPNHVHLVAVPEAADAFEKVLRPLHTRYAHRANRPREWTGALWQGRYYASPLGESHLWATLRYVDRNPVRAGMVGHACDYAWSSAAAHCGLRPDPVLTNHPTWSGVLQEIPDWREWLREFDNPQDLEVIRDSARAGRPCGSERFVRDLERRCGRALMARPRGRPSKK